MQKLEGNYANLIVIKTPAKSKKIYIIFHSLTYSLIAFLYLFISIVSYLDTYKKLKNILH